MGLAGKLISGSMSSSIKDFKILQAFKVAANPCKAPIIKPVTWFPPKCNWIKCNSDGAIRGAPDQAACGDIFRDYSVATLGCFA